MFLFDLSYECFQIFVDLFQRKNEHLQQSHNTELGTFAILQRHKKENLALQPRQKNLNNF